MPAPRLLHDALLSCARAASEYYPYIRLRKHLPVGLTGETQDLGRPHLPELRLLLVEVQEHFREDVDSGLHGDRGRD